MRPVQGAGTGYLCLFVVTVMGHGAAIVGVSRGYHAGIQLVLPGGILPFAKQAVMLYRVWKIREAAQNTPCSLNTVSSLNAWVANSSIIMFIH